MGAARGPHLVTRSISIRKEHWPAVRALRCVISAQPEPTLHHVHGGSVSRLLASLGEHKRGKGQKTNDALVIPIASEFHTGAWGIDNGLCRFGVVAVWEQEFGEQVAHLEWVSRQLGYNVFRLAGLEINLEGVDNDVVSRP